MKSQVRGLASSGRWRGANWRSCRPGSSGVFLNCRTGSRCVCWSADALLNLTNVNFDGEKATLMHPPPPPGGRFQRHPLRRVNIVTVLRSG